MAGEVLAEAVGVVRGGAAGAGGGEEGAAGFGEARGVAADADHLGELHAVEAVERVQGLAAEQRLEQGGVVAGRAGRGPRPLEKACEDRERFGDVFGYRSVRGRCATLKSQAPPEAELG